MSNDPNQPKPGQGKTRAISSKPSTEVTEADLWDLDSDRDPIAPDKASETAKSETHPARRKSRSHILPKRNPEVEGTNPYVSAVKKPAAYVPDTESNLKPDANASGKSGDETEGAETPGDGDATAKTDEVTAGQPFFASLTKMERIAISALFAALILAATLAIIHFTNRVPTRSPISEETDFPVSGKLVEVKSAVTYWRKPITTGQNPDVVRRSTALIPVVKLTLQSKPCAIRVFFRDEEGVVIGDGISRDVSGGQELVIPATAGFDDIGMHAAYRTGENDPWTVQIFEGPSLGADRKDFRKVVEIQISTDRR